MGSHTSYSRELRTAKGATSLAAMVGGGGWRLAGGWQRCARLAAHWLSAAACGGAHGSRQARASSWGALRRWRSSRAGCATKDLLSRVSYKNGTTGPSLRSGWQQPTLSSR